ncbi:ferredoxin [Kocuria dechangensis]|uniref:Ferredoxin n=1 Tax=Kocuria dechangensis TaxID=1176249 RepID=A0A917GME2_9MICC|nr:FAD/NAD(P)-binding oxidoreductase [Kocuria dechangensis]GGG51759.1 ferredoxin [Kocuria dechangensis]
MAQDQTRSHGLLIIGASQSGVALAGSLRALGYQDPITLLGEEDHRPYQRPALSKEFLQDKVDKEKLIFRAHQYWDDHRIELVKGERVERIEKNPDGSGVARSTTGAEFPFDRLALTVGARARRLELDGADLGGVLYLRNADDALELKAQLPSAEHLVVIGGGFIGLEAAASAHAMGKAVTVLEVGPRLIGRAVGEETSQFFLDAHRAAGIEVRLGVQLSRIVGEDGRVTGVELGDGTVVPADIVLVGIGVVPNTELAEELGLECGNGIRVDEYALASDGHTVAIGDCANMPNPIPGAPADERLRLESVNNAVEHAKVAAYSLTGRREEYRSIPWFWSNQGPYKLQIAGLSVGHDRTVVRRDGTDGKLCVLYYRDGRLIAADCVNSGVDFLDVKAALTKGLTVPADDAADPARRLKELAVSGAPEPLPATPRS